MTSSPSSPAAQQESLQKDPNRLVRRESSRFSLRDAWTKNQRAPTVFVKDVLLPEKYEGYPLLQSMMRQEETRRILLDKNGSKQRNYTKSTDGWFKTMMTIQGRALDNIALPWALCTVNAIVWTIYADRFHVVRSSESTSSWEFFFGIVLNTSLSFLLVFRLNRAAERYWLARENWGTIIGVSRYLSSGILVHGSHRPVERERALRWICAFAIATMQYIRSSEYIPPESLDGILTEDSIIKMQNSVHPPMYAAHQLRDALNKIFLVSAETPLSLAYAWTQQMSLLEQSLNRIMDQEGAMERIRSSPLPLVYVTHLRTFLLFFLMALPYIWEHAWGWATIPLSVVTAFALLGLDGAAAECEAPFREDRPNHLNMGGFCLLVQMNVQQSIQDAADLELEKKGTTTAALWLLPTTMTKEQMYGTN